MKQRPVRTAEEVLPQSQRAHSPARINLIRAVAHADDSRLATGTRAAIGRTVGIKQPDFLPGPLEMVSRPRAEDPGADRSEEHTSELQSRLHLVCRLLLEKK